jgi:hypothetical protein
MVRQQYSPRLGFDDCAAESIYLTDELIERVEMQASDLATTHASAEGLERRWWSAT